MAPLTSIYLDMLERIRYKEGAQSAYFSTSCNGEVMLTPFPSCQWPVQCPWDCMRMPIQHLYQFPVHSEPTTTWYICYSLLKINFKLCYLATL